MSDLVDSGLTVWVGGEEKFHDGVAHTEEASGEVRECKFYDQSSGLIRKQCSSAVTSNDVRLWLSTILQVLILFI